MGEGAEMTTSEERRLGDDIAREIYRDPQFLDDAILYEYVNGIWQELMLAARQRGPAGGQPAGDGRGGVADPRRAAEGLGPRRGAPPDPAGRCRTGRGPGCARSGR